MSIDDNHNMMINKNTILTTVAIIVIIAMGLGWYVWNQNKNVDNKPISTVNSSNNLNPMTTDNNPAPSMKDAKIEENQASLATPTTDPLSNNIENQNNSKTPTQTKTDLSKNSPTPTKPTQNNNSNNSNSTPPATQPKNTTNSSTSNTASNPPAQSPTTSKPTQSKPTQPTPANQDRGAFDF